MKSQLSRINKLYNVRELPVRPSFVGSGFGKRYGKTLINKIRTLEEDTPAPGEVILLDEGEGIE